MPAFPRFFWTLVLPIILSPTLSAQSQKPTRPASAAPFVLGEILQLQSAVLNETRTLNVYLPAGYSPDSTKKYPVIYLLDGSADEDFIHIVGLVQFGTFPWLNNCCFNPEV